MCVNNVGFASLIRRRDTHTQTHTDRLADALRLTNTLRHIDDGCTVDFQWFRETHAQRV